MLFNEGYMHKHLKIRSSILAALIVASFFTATFLPTTTLAVDNTKSPNDNARALAYFYTLRRCMAETFSGGLTSLTEERINNFSWLTGYKLPLGAQFISSNGDWDGNVSCDGGGEYGSWRQDAVSALGYGSNRDLLCNVMHPYQSLSVDPDNGEASRGAIEDLYNKCKNGQGDLDVSQLVTAKDQNSVNKNFSNLSGMFNRSVGQKFFSDPSPISSNGVEISLQQLFYTTFQKFCQPTDYSGGSVGNDLRKVSIKRFDLDTKQYEPVDVLIKADRVDNTTDVIAHGVLPSGEPNKTLDSSTMDCQQIIDKTNSYADKAQVVYDALPKETRNAIDTGIVKDSSTGSDSGTDTSSCTIDGIGWILCPVMNFTGGIIDGAYGVISGMLTTSPSMFDTSKSEGQATQTAWSLMRNIANVAFVIVFLIIIFSQLSSIGITNYGIKKMLPKLVVAAILVNVSFYICAIAVDLSNILGSSLKGLIDNVSNSIPLSRTDSAWDAAWNGGNIWTYAVGGLIASGVVATGVLYAGLSVLLPLLIAALAAIVTVIVVLTLRQALIVLLIVIAPLAFIALLLPNTEGLFKKWRSLLTTLLLMYPIIALIFGASALAGKIIMGSSTNMLVQIMGAGVTVIPLFITPVIMKTAGGLLNRFGGVINNPNKGPLDRMRKGADGLRKDRQNLRNMRALGGDGQFGRGRVVRWGARRKAISSGREAEMNRANTGYVAEQAESNSAFRNAVAGGTNKNAASVAATERALASSINTQYKLEADEVNASKVVIEHANLSGAERQQLAMTGSIEKNGQIYSGATMQKAALQEQLRTGSMGQINDIIANSGGNLSQFSQTISQGVASNNIGSKNPAFGGKTIDDIAQGKITSQADVDATILSAIKEGKFTAETMASMHDLSRTRAIEVAYASDDRSYEQILKKAAQDIKSTPELSTKLSGNVSATRQVEELSNLP